MAGATAVPLLAVATPADAATAVASVTDLYSSASTALAGTPVMLRAFVDPTDGGGTVTFTSNGTTIPGCASLPFLSGGESDWETACTTSSLPAGSDTITATYSGDAAFAGSSGSATETITGPTSTSLTASPSQAYTQAPVTLTAHVSGGDSGGTVTFTSNGAAISGCAGLPFSSGSGADWQAACTTSSLPAGSDTITATYSGDAMFAGSSGSATENIISQQTTSTSLTVSSGQVYARLPVTLTAYVSGGDGGGTVAFVAGNVGQTQCYSVPLTGHTATCTVPSWPATRLITATAYYSGDSATSGSAGSTLVTAALGPAPTTTSLTLSSTKAVWGQEQAERVSVTVTSVPGATPDGSVQVSWSGGAVCTIFLVSGGGACTVPAAELPVGAVQLAAFYSGSANFTESGDGASLTVSKAPTTTALSLSPAGVVYGNEQAEQLSATVTSPSGTPDGAVTVTSGTTTICTITLAAGTGSCTLTATQLPAGTSQLTAAYSGSASFAGSASAAQPLTVSSATTTTALSLSLAGVVYGDEQGEQVSATVVPQYGGTPDGTVTVTSGTTTICTITLAAGTGSCTMGATQLPAGTGQLTAAYSGSASFAGSASAAQPLTVTTATTTTTLSLSPAKETYGDEQTEQVSATVVPQYGGTPDGTVTVTSGTTTICTITLTAGTGSCTLAATQLPASTSQLTAAYSGSASFAGSVSATTTLTVAKAITTTTLSLSATTVTHGQEQAERLTVSVAPQYGGTPDGTVTIKSGTTTICTITLAAGTGSCTMGASKLAAGTHTLTAAYAGSGNFAGSTSAAQTLTVAK